MTEPIEDLCAEYVARIKGGPAVSLQCPTVRGDYGTATMMLDAESAQTDADGGRWAILSLQVKGQTPDGIEFALPTTIWLHDSGDDHIEVQAECQVADLDEATEVDSEATTELLKSIFTYAKDPLVRFAIDDAEPDHPVVVARCASLVDSVVDIDYCVGRMIRAAVEDYFEMLSTDSEAPH